MKRSKWRRRFRHDKENQAVASWLGELGSLTARCQAAATDFRVKVLSFAKGEALADEGLYLPRRCGHNWVREVMLEADGMPVIFAHTVLPGAPRGKLTRWLARLGNRSLGSLLFSYPGFRRGTIEFLKLGPQHPLYQRAAAAGEVGATLWARRSLHRLGRQRVLVTEVFLPAVTRLEGRNEG